MLLAPKVETRGERSLLCVAGTISDTKAFPQNFRSHLPRACAVVCDDIERFGELMRIHRNSVIPSYADLRQLGDVLSIQWLSIISKTHFSMPFAHRPPIVRSHIGQSGLFIWEHLHDKPHEFPLVLSTTFSCYVLLNDNDEARLHDHFENHVFAGSFATTPILAFGFITDRLVLPTPRAVERDKPLEFYERFIPTDEIVLGVY